MLKILIIETFSNNYFLFGKKVNHKFRKLIIINDL